MMRKSFLPFSPPCIGEEEIAEVADTLSTDWLTTGPKVKRFEREFAASVGASAALALSSCTSALHLALVTLGIGPGDAVITTPMTFCSGVNVIEHVGARPILVDVEPDTLNIDAAKVEEALKRLSKERAAIHAKAILPVHLYGHPCDVEALLQIAEEYGLDVIEDAAHALPAKYKGRMIGAPVGASKVRVLSCYSFYATKNLTTGEGGMLTGPPELVEEARIWGLHGMSRDAWKRYSSEGSWYYEVVRAGFKCNMTDMQAAIGLHQLKKLEGFHARRREIVGRYNESFSPLEQFQTPVERPEVEHAWHLYALRLNSERFQLSRSRFIEELKARNIGASVHFIPIHLHPYYQNKYAYKPEDFPVAYQEYQRLVSLPLSPRMDDGDVADVIEAVRDIVVRNSVRQTVAFDGLEAVSAVEAGD
jgi:dTDP-4-amino-4,6-dideoxygalactose transaminase